MLLLRGLHRRAVALRRVDLQEMVDQIEEALVEHTGRNRLARNLDHRVIARTDRQRHRTEHAQADARRRAGLLQRVAVLHRVHISGARRAIRARVRADHMKRDHHVRVVARLEILAAVDRVQAGRARHVALAQQRAPRGFASRVGFRLERARVGALGRVELLLLVKRRRRGIACRQEGCDRARSG